MDDASESEPPTTPPSQEVFEPRGEVSAWLKVQAKRLSDLSSSYHAKMERAFALLNQVHDLMGTIEGVVNETVSVARAVRKEASLAVAEGPHGLLQVDAGEAAGAQLFLPLGLPQGLAKGPLPPEEAAVLTRAVVKALSQAMTFDAKKGAGR